MAIASLRGATCMERALRWLTRSWSWSGHRDVLTSHTRPRNSPSGAKDSKAMNSGDQLTSGQRASQKKYSTRTTQGFSQIQSKSWSNPSKQMESQLHSGTKRNWRVSVLAWTSKITSHQPSWHTYTMANNLHLPPSLQTAIRSSSASTQRESKASKSVWRNYPSRLISVSLSPRGCLKRADLRRVRSLRHMPTAEQWAENQTRECNRVSSQSIWLSPTA